MDGAERTQGPGMGPRMGPDSGDNFTVNLKMDQFSKHWHNWDRYAKQHMAELI